MKSLTYMMFLQAKTKETNHGKKTTSGNLEPEVQLCPLSQILIC